MKKKDGKTVIHPGLPKAQCDDSEEHLPAPSRARYHQSNFRLQGRVLHKVGRMLGIQQTYESRRGMSGRPLSKQIGASLNPSSCFFGLTNSPATFQTMMNDIFKDLIDKGYVVIYMDDILVYTPHNRTSSGDHDPSPGCTPKNTGSTSRPRSVCSSAPQWST